MNFLKKSPSKSSPLSKQTSNRQRKRPQQKESEEYIDVELEIQEDNHPEVPRFIGAPVNTGEAGVEDLQDEFLYEDEEDDCELGEEARTFANRQRERTPVSRPPQQRPYADNFTPRSGGSDLNHVPPISATNSWSPSMPMSNHSPWNSQYPQHSAYSSPYHASPGVQQGMYPNMSNGYVNAFPPQIPYQVDPYTQPMMYPPHQPQPLLYPPHQPEYSYNAPAEYPYEPNYGLTDFEMAELEQLVANGVPEFEAMKTIQHNRLIRQPGSRRQPGIPDEDEQILQIILKESAEVEKQRQDQLHRDSQMQGSVPSRHNYVGLSSEEALTIALQQSYEDYERIKRSNSGSQPGSSGRGIDIGRSNQRPVMSEIEKANDQALRQAIFLSMQEAGHQTNPSNSYQNRSRPGTNSQNSPRSHPSSYDNWDPHAHSRDGMGPQQPRSQMNSYDNWDGHGYADSREGMGGPQPRSLVNSYDNLDPQTDHRLGQMPRSHVNSYDNWDPHTHSRDGMGPQQSRSQMNSYDNWDGHGHSNSREVMGGPQPRSQAHNHDMREMNHGSIQIAPSHINQNMSPPHRSHINFNRNISQNKEPQPLPDNDIVQIMLARNNAAELRKSRSIDDHEGVPTLTRRPFETNIATESNSSDYLDNVSDKAIVVNNLRPATKFGSDDNSANTGLDSRSQTSQISNPRQFRAPLQVPRRSISVSVKQDGSGDIANVERG